ncbi:MULTISPECIES: protein phosphatase 2C domain-containing protein [Pseudanabaena]|uniref:protein phosphatase 2C domain-containing protein n=1 Tax=Pseudanabaena TaxID=1152 RepID=UPI00247A29EA|nr:MULTISPECIES: protein phosphatase 2C domain-containing protein [Pseudanabaena]MEA5489088.1 protein phosphatase 2C domain-containing protein [Pseudanabaena sp. CCNP1317]WGS73074.1 protein phosphatase 2C domain-containing protein [Pseudanabaena galeata CCNP1313]
MSICPSCKAVNPDSHQFCQFCGTKITVEITIDSTFNILGDVAIQPSSIPTRPLNLESVLEEIKIQVEDLASSQVVSDTEKFAPEEELPLEFNLEDFADVESEMTMVLSSTMHLQDLTYAGKTDVGMQRDRNEDDFVTILQTRSINGKSQISDRSHRGLFVLCDGMGGHEGGEVASAIAVNSITEQFRPFWIDTLPGEKKINEIICKANQQIFAKNESEKRQSLGRMGTTLVVLAIHDLDLVIAHVGDSRIYKVTNSHQELKLEPKLEQITRDHEVLNQLIDLGVEIEVARARPDAHQLTQALGPNPSDRLEPAIEFFTLTEPTLFLLCSDGLCDNDAIEDNWRSHLLPILNKETDLQTGLDNLIELGNNVNGHDNLTAILVLCEPSTSSQKYEDTK